MADAERIWLEPECCAEPGVGRTWCSVNEWTCCPAGECDAPKPTEYVRADLVAAREAAAALAMREACADYVADCLAELGLPLGVASIRALPLPAPDALARALEQARVEEREMCALIADDEAKDCRTHRMAEGWAAAATIRDTIRAQGKEKNNE